MNSVFFSPGSKSFYLQELFPEYEDAGTLPDDVIEITRETYEQFLGLHPEGKEIGADSSGRPVWINSPPPSKEDEVLTAEMKKISLKIKEVYERLGSDDYILSVKRKYGVSFVVLNKEKEEIIVDDEAKAILEIDLGKIMDEIKRISQG